MMLAFMIATIMHLTPVIPVHPVGGLPDPGPQPVIPVNPVVPPL
jgi:hypothetical protein